MPPSLPHPTPAPATRRHFKHLNGLRFIAAALVIVHHIEQCKGLSGVPNGFSTPVVQHMGGDAVTFFFVLSGFLITYLLLEEKARQGTVDTSRFYAKRALRIWPVYWVVTVLGFFVVPHIGFLPHWSDTLPNDFGLKALLFFTFLPQVALLLFDAVPYAAQAWSIGVEEQFYVAWPLLVKYARHTGRAIVAFLAGFWGLKLLAIALQAQGWPDAWSAYKAVMFLYNNRLDAMAIGALSAWLLQRPGEHWHRLFINRGVQAVALVLVVAAEATEVLPYQWRETMLTLPFALIIVNWAVHPRPLLPLEFPVLRYLGTISYGLYMFHILALGLAIALLRALGASLSDPSLYVATFTLAIALAAASYRWLEAPLLSRLRPAADATTAPRTAPGPGVERAAV